MKPESMQNISQVLLFIGIVLTAFGGYGSYYFGKKIEKSKEIDIHKKIDTIPQEINSNSDKNSSSVLKAIENVQLSVDEIAAVDGSKFKQINYPDRGEFGINILDKAIKKYTIGTYSMRVEIPKNQGVIVKVSGSNWVFPVFQSIPGWRHYDYEQKEDKTIRKFKTVKSGIVDFEMYLNNIGEIELTIYENESEDPSWQKTIVVD